MGIHIYNILIHNNFVYEYNYLTFNHHYFIYNNHIPIRNYLIHIHRIQIYNYCIGTSVGRSSWSAFGRSTARTLVATLNTIIFFLLAQAVSIPVGRHSGGRLATTLVATLSITRLISIVPKPIKIVVVVIDFWFKKIHVQKILGQKIWGKKKVRSEKSFG